MRFLLPEIDKSLVLKLNKSIKADGVNGIIDFGEKNDYPQIIERLINNSVTAKTSANIYAKFLNGAGFENEMLNNYVVGRDSLGKPVTLLSLLRSACVSISKYNGFYIHANYNANLKVDNVLFLPFKNVRFAKPDDTGYSAKVAYSEDWAAKVSKDKIKFYHTYNSNEDVLTAQINGEFTKFGGQVFFQFTDSEFLYPLSNFDEVYLDMDTEYNISLFKNRQIRNGMFDKVVFRVAPGQNETDNQDFAQKIKSFMGADGESVLVVEDDIAPDGEVAQNGNFRIDKIESNVNDKLFEQWEKSISNNIRKSAKGVPAILIDYEQSNLGNTSGEAVREATNYYNALTSDDRALIENSFKELFSNFKDETIAKNNNWRIKPLNLISQKNDGVSAEISDTPDSANAQAQAQLRGSVGGVQGILQIQTGVSQGLTDYNAAIEILKEIYGFDEIKARAILGTPKTT